MSQAWRGARIDTGRHALLTPLPIFVQFQNIADRSLRFFADFLHQTDGPLDNVAQLAGALIIPLQYCCGPLQMVARKYVGWRHVQSP